MCVSKFNKEETDQYNSVERCSEEVDMINSVAHYKTEQVAWKKWAVSDRDLLPQQTEVGILRSPGCTTKNKNISKINCEKRSQISLVSLYSWKCPFKNQNYIRRDQFSYYPVRILKFSQKYILLDIIKNDTTGKNDYVTETSKTI